MRAGVAEPSSSFEPSTIGSGKILIKRPDGSTEDISHCQILWIEQRSRTIELGLRELDAVLNQLHRDDDKWGIRVSLDTKAQFPAPGITHPSPCTEPNGDPVYLGSVAIHGGVHPCKVSPRLGSTLCRVSYGGEEIAHQGKYDLLPFKPDLMEFVDSVNGTPPTGRRAVVGGYEGPCKLYHAIARVNGVWVPGKAGPHLMKLGAMVPYNDKENWSRHCRILCWK